MARDLIQPLNPYNTFVNTNGLLTRDAYDYLYGIFIRLGGSLSNLNAATLQDGTWQSPGTIGSVTPNTGAFTTLTASGAVDLGTAGTGVVLQGTTAATDAAAGKIGEYQTATASAVALTTATDTTINSLNLGAGDWDVEATFVFKGQVGTTSFTQIVCGLGTALTMPTPLSTTSMVFPATLANTVPYAITTPRIRFSLNSATVIRGIARAAFTAGTANADVLIRARRVR